MTTNDNNRRRRYEKPTVRVVELHNRTMILAGSGGMGDRSPYIPDDENPFGG